MIQQNSPVDPEIHKAACIIARRFTTMIGGILRDEEKGECEREGYMIAREVMEELAVFKGKA
jgi:hypothetical protein